MQVQTIDHAALLPLYLAAASAVLALFAGRFAKAAMMIGLTAAAIAAVWVGVGPDRAAFNVGEWHSYVADDPAMGAAALFAAVTVLVAGISGRQAGEYWFLLAASASGGIALAGSRDLISLIVALETLTVPLYVLVTKPGRDGAEAGVTFLISSITASATALMGAALLYSAAGTVHLGGLPAGLADADAGLTAAGVALLLGGLAFKLAAAPLHAWAPLVLERAPLPIATYLASASKLGGALAIVWLVHFGLTPGAGAFGDLLPPPEGFPSAPVAQRSAGIVLAALSVASIAVGNLAALAQRRTVPLLAWSGVAHAGYVLAPLAVITTADGREEAGAAASAALAYAVLFVLLEAGAFTALTAVRPGSGDFLASEEGRTPEADLKAGGPPVPDLKADAPVSGLTAGHRRTLAAPDRLGDGGRISELTGLWRTAPLPASLLLFSVIGLAGLPPALAGTFAKVAILEVLASSAVWLAVIVAAGAVVGLAYYLPLARTLLLGRPATLAGGRFAIAVAAIGLALLAASLAPQLVLEFTSVLQ
ncbi:NADH-quinone oxidoreductase subunit N [Glycomyces harbinensis]|uniref:NADH-quinone oxidoreductase subunit N n=1 Tax=Glycomyces harbinensis TaxID=58114 RepID=A0A1G6UWK0_9ACTN|nr:proton-conducting transporter membrane subunit [Glycomyces harbinensis]SDD45708.1 NADH-quinone oxidoreductase subunit N [Glycomyces harbinensis]